MTVELLQGGCRMARARRPARIRNTCSAPHSDTFSTRSDDDLLSQTQQRTYE